MGTKIRLTALILAASLTMNMVIMPVKAEDIAAPIEQLESEPVESIAAQTESSEPTSPTTESSEPALLTTESSEPTSPTTESSEPTSPTTESSEPTSPTTESSEPTSPTTESSEPGTGEESSDLPGLLLTPEEEETLLEETGESMLFSTLTRAEPDVSEPLKALAAETAVPLLADQEIEIHSGEELYFLAKKVQPEIYQNCVLKFINSKNGFDVSGYADFPGLSNDEEHPFGGQIKFVEGSGSTVFKLKQPLFQYLSASARVEPLLLEYAGEETNQGAALFAANVVGNGGGGNWNFTLQGDSENKDVTCTPPLIGIIAAGSNVSLQVKDLIDLPVEAAGNAGAGLLCGTLNGSLTLTSLNKEKPISVKATDGAAGGLVGEMGANGSLTVNLNPVTENDISKPATLKIEDVSATGNAGGLVGKMAAGATLTINTDVEISGSVTTSGGDAGGLVGLAEHNSADENPKTVTIKAVTYETSQTASNLTLSATAAISGTGSGGGLIGSATDIIFDGGLPTITGTGSISGANAGGLIGSYTYSGTVNDSLSTVSQNISGITVNGSSNAGGVFGVLNNNTLDDTFTISSPSVSTTALSGNNAGGLIGQYSASNLAAALNVTSPSVSSALSGSANTYGGLIGWVSGGPAYLELSGSVALTGTAKNYGGLIGSLYDSNEKDSGHMVVVNDVTITKKVNGTIKGTETAGGLIGYQPHGVLKLSGDVTVDAPDCDKKAYLGNILGRRDNTLVYSTSQWKPRGGGKNDIGNWGQVLSIVTGGVLDGLITEENHTVMVNNSDCSTSIGTPLDFARIALGLQLETKGALVVTPISGDLDITLTKDINLSGTGLTGFQRDVSVTARGVTLNGDGHTITLPGIKTYVNSGAHDYQGLFSKVTNLKAEDLTISGSGSYTEGETTISNVGIQLECNGDFYVGGLAADASGDITLTSVTAGASIITNNGSNASIGGLVGRRSFEDTNNGTLTCSSCSWTSTIRVSGNSSGIYVGGLVGRVDNDGKSGVGMEMSFTDCTISGKLSRTGKPDDARIGGMLGACYGRLNNNATDPLCFNLLIDGVTVDGATVTSDAKNEMGGLLSLEWLNSNVTVKNVVVKDSTVSSTNTSSFGGLVFKATGYCKIEGTQTTDGSGVTTVKSGVTIESGTFSGPSPAAAPSALLICHGEERGTLNNALYLEILDGAYKIVPSGIDLELKNSSTTFDEIIGTTFGDKANGKGNGIVSIATPGDLIYKEANGVKSRNTYEKQLSTDYTNPNTRYYYNLDSFGAVDNPPSGDINRSQNMVMFSAYSHADDSIKGYFYSNPGNITNPTDGIIDLTGYSYYPAEQYATVQNATIKFDFANIETREEGNKKPSDATRQHAGMHTGIFRNVVNSGDSDATLSVTNLTLQGSVGHVDGRSGALICGDVHGNSTKSKKMILEIHGVSLNGIAVSPAPRDGTVAPLLINSLGSYTTLNMSGVVTADYAADVTAASSLIGPVGGDTGAAINLTFSDMALDGIQRADGKTYNGKDSIFSRALFLESFRYSESNCSGVYNFGDNATRYTVGRELSNTGGGTVDGRNNGAQYWFHNSDTLVCSPDTDKETHYQGYRRYVHWVEGKDGNDAADVKSHEIDVNVRTFGLTKGCGTYSHPYIITDGNQLKELAEVLNSGGKKEGWKVNLYSDALSGNFSSNDVTCDGCIEYTGTANSWVQTGGPQTQSAPKVLQYLRNAYYVIRGPEDSETKEITLSGTWAGLGGNETNTAFSGVIVGEDGVTVKIARSDLGQQFGGLIKFSQGSVVKNLKIAYTETPTVTANGVPTTSDASFFGGVVGWCIGGDTIIDNVTVTYQNGEPTFSGNNDHLTAVGGYVGMVGGAINDAGDSSREKYGGGVVFRGDIGGGLGGKSDNYFYYNPYVGRVLDGYVLSEKTKLDNTDDNYQIPTITADKHLNIADGTVTVNDAQGLWLLSAIANSGAGAMTDANCLAYNVGKPRTGTYDDVGGALKAPMAEYSDETLLGGVGGTDSPRTTCYLSKYVDGDFYNLCSSGVSIVLNSDCDMSGYGNGFRGIGASYATNANGDSNYRLIQVSSVNGNNHIVTLGQSRKEYTDEKDNWTSIGSGLFVLLRVPSTGFTASNLTFKGRTGIAYYTGLMPVTGDDMRTYTSGRVYEAGAGALAANLANGVAASITVDNVKLDTLSVNVQKSDDKTIRGSTHAGGLFGSAKFNYSGNSPVRLKLQDCTYSNLTVIGRDNAGGFLGYVEKVNAEISYTKSCEPLTNGNISTTLTLNTQKTGVGGLMGYWYGKDSKTYNIAISGVNENNPLTMTDLTLDCGTDNSGNDLAFCGGLAGLWYANNDETVTTSISHVSIQGNIQITGGSGEKSTGNTGGLVGAITNNLGEWKTGTSNMSIDVSDVHIADNPGSAMIVERSRQIGAVFGVVKVSKTVAVRNLYLGAEGNSVTVANRGQKNDQSAGGVIGIGSYTPTITMENLHLDGVTILGHYNTSISAGMVIGRHHNQNGSMTMTMDMKNVELRNCTIAVDHDSSYAGLLYGQIHEKTQTITGSNILIKDCTVGLSLNEAGNAIQSLTSGEPGTIGLKKSSYASYEALKTNTDYLSFTKPDNVAIFGGKVAGTVNVKLVGVSIQQTDNTLPMKDFGTNPGTGSYVVRADYKGYQDGTITGAKAPYVTTSPRSPLNIPDKTITGDGASFVKDTTTPVGGQILEDLKDPATNLNLKHSAALAYGESASDANAKKAYTYLLENSGKAFFGDFKQQGGNADYSDVTDASKVNFPVLTLVTNSSVDANRLIYSWISLLTNCAIKPSSTSKALLEGVTITPIRYKWSDNAWGIDTTQEQELPLQWDSNKKEFTLKKGVYDSGQNRFTLLDVAFADPAGGSEPAYHLYIPVIVQKMLRFRFWASAQTGTTYIKSSYMQQDALAAASHGQQVTVLMGFEYKRKQADWQEAVDNGDNLLFGFEKTIQLEGTSLPSGTRLTLVDCANQNKVYYADGSAITRVQGSETKHQLSFTDFNGWSPVCLCDMLELRAEKNTNGKYYLSDVSGATVQISNGKGGYTYYRYYSEDETKPESGDAYSITVRWKESDKEPRLKEQYYLTIQTPEKPLERFEICNNEITCPSSLGSAKLLPTLRENNESGNKYTLNGNENRVLIGDFFTQEVAIDTVESYPEMSTANHTIRATLTSKIKFSSPQSAEKFKAYAEGQNLFQSFDLRMQKTEKAGEQAQRTNLVPGTRITAAYFLGDTPVGTKTYTIARSTPSFRLDFPAGVDVGNWDAQNGATFKAELTLEYPDAAILAQFPLINGNPGNLGVNLGTSSYLAYTEDALPTTTIHKDAQWDAQNFYRRDFKAASLNYYPVKRTANSTVESVNQLGVNGWNQQNSRINSAATYDASALDGAGNAKTLRCTLRLKQKANDDSYVEVDNWADYLAEGNNPTVSAHYNTSGVNAAVASSTLSRNVYTTQFTLTSYEKDVPIEIQVDMNVLTGADFEAEGKALMTYANYKVEMCVELLDSTGTNVIAGSRAEDYIVYTNARINPNPIR